MPPRHHRPACAEGGQVMPLEAWWNKAPEQLVELRHSLSAGTPDAITVDRMLELRIAESQAEGSDKLLASTTDKLVAATHRLGTVTWWLVAGTLLLGLSAAVDVILKV